MEAELIAASSACDKALWFFYLLESLPFLFGNIDPSPIPLFVDNLAALRLPVSVTNHPNSGAKSRHVALRELELGIIMRQIKFVPTGVPDRLMWPISFRKHSIGISVSHWH